MTTRSIRTCLAVSLLAACGGDDVHHLADAPSTDNTLPDAPTEGVATLTVTQDGAPVSGVTVHFQNADGSLISTKATDANGDASATVRIGAIVTDIDPPPPPVATFGSTNIFNTLHTWAGVKPNDHLHLDLVTTAPPQANLTLTLPDDGQSHYQLFTSCGINGIDVTPPPVGSAVAANQPVNISIPVCSAKQDFVALAQDSDFITVDALIATDVTVTDATNIDLSAATWTAVTSTNYTYANLPADVGGVNVFASLVTAKGPMFSASGFATADANAATTAIPMPASQAVAATVSRVSTGNTDQNIVDWGPLGDVNVDVGTALLKQITDLPLYDATTHAVTWPEAATGVEPDLVRTSLEAFRTDQASNTNHFWTWELAAPHGTTGAAFPTLPVGEFDFNTVATDQANLNTLVVAKVPGGYDAARATIMNVSPPGGLVAGPTGHAVVEQIQRGELTLLGRAVNRARTSAKLPRH